jgi:hypothetical protein
VNDQPPSTSSPAPPVESSLPVDPLRLLGGLWKRKLWVVAGLFLGLGLGAAAGLLKTKTRYQVSVQLIKQELPSSFRVGEVGEAFRPHELAPGTLIGAAGSPDVLQRVAERTGHSLGDLQGSIEVAAQKNTDFVFLTLSGFKSAKDTAGTANVWAEEVVRFTREMQSQESRGIRQFLQQQVDATDAEQRKINDQILDYAQREDLVDADKQITTTLSNFSEIDLKYETTRINLDTVAFKIKGVEAELKRQSPLSEKLRAAQAEIEELRAQYTDKNPILIEKLEKLKTLEEQVTLAEANQNADSSSYAGTFLGNTLYLELVQLQNEQTGLRHEMEEYEKLRRREREKLNAIPAKAAALAQLTLQKQSLEVARTLLFSRLREAQLFEENAPGYYRLFAPATEERVSVRGKTVKAGIITVAGGVFLAGAALFFALLAELLDPKLRTRWEAVKAFKAPLLGAIPKAGGDRNLGAEIWANWIGAHPAAGQPRIIWAPQPGEEERLFWDLLLQRASLLLPSLVVVDCGEVPLPAEAPKNVRIERLEVTGYSIPEARQLGGQLQERCRRGEEVWVRLAGPVHEPLTTIAHCGQPGIVLVPLHTGRTENWRTQGELLTRTVSPPAGIIALAELPWYKRK